MSYTHVSKSNMFSPLTGQSNSLSSLASTDADLFREAFRKEPTCYCNNWLYMLRATRDDQGGCGYKFVGKDVLIGVGYRHQIAYFVHPMGNNRFTETLALCQKIQYSMHCPIILKKVDQELYEFLRSTELFQKQRDASLSCDETFLKYSDTAMSLEEEAFPEHMLHLSALYGSATGVYNQPGSFIRKVRRFKKTAVTLFPKNDCLNIETMPGFSTLFAPASEKYQSYIQMIREVNKHKEDDRYKVCAYYDEDNVLHGLYISASLGEGSMGLYCAVSSRDFPGITEWMDYSFFQQLYQEGVHYLYLGGSETSGVDAYIKKLFPITPPYLLQPMQLDDRNKLSSDLYTISAD